MSLSAAIVMFGLIASVGVFGYRCYVRIQHLRLGRSTAPFGNWWKRLWGVVVHVGGQQRVFRFRNTGTAHFFIFWGFVLLLPTILQAIGEGLFSGFTLPFFGTFAPWLLVQDLMAAAVSIAVLYGLYVREVLRPRRYEGSHQFEGNLVLCLILTIMVTLLVHHGIQQNLEQTGVGPRWQPIAAAVGVPFRGLALGAQESVAHACWWIHLGVVLVFLTLLPLGKHFHVVTSIIGVYLRNLAPRGRLVVQPGEAGTEGAQRIEQFTWRQMLDWYSCSECGRCQEVCPAYGGGAPLSPKRLIMALRSHLFERGEALRAKRTGGSEAEDGAAAPRLVGDVLTEESVWACTTCHACDTECPLFVEHIQPLVEMRRGLLAEQRCDKSLAGALESLRRYGNSFGKSDKQRAKWSAGLDFKIKDIRRQPAETLWFVGDYASYSPTLTPVTQATARVFRTAGLDFGVLYDGERNAGNDVRRCGEEGLFALLAQKNGAALGKSEFQRIVTTDPHTYNTLKNEYTVANGASKPLSDIVPILHHAEILAELIAGGRLPILRKLDTVVTYHDPCYLGRYNDVYEAPRRVLKAIGCRLVEMPRNRDRALCCGAGGGRIWMDEGKVMERPSESRVREAAALEGVQCLVVACPKDLTMYRDAVKTAGLEGRLGVRELIELVDEATRPQCPQPVPTHTVKTVTSGFGAG